MSMLFVGGAVNVYALNATKSPANGEYIYSVDAFGSEYSAGYLCLSNGQVSAALQTMNDNSGNTTEIKIWGNNTSKDTSVYVDYTNGAVNNGVYYDVRVYYWKDDITTYYYVKLSTGEVGTVSSVDGSRDNTVTEEFHFYKAGTNFTEEVSWSGVLRLQDLDIDEGYTFESGLQYGNVWLSDPTNVVKTGTNTWRGTYENDNSGTDAEEETVWACVTGSPSTPLRLTYWGASAHGSEINYKGASVTYKLVDTSGSEIPTGAADTISSDYYCALYGEYAPVDPGTFTRYTFSGWYLDEALTQPVDGSIMVTGEITLYGTYYKIGGYIYTSVINGDITDDAEDVPYGEDYTVDYEPDDGYQLQSVTVDGTKVDITKYPSSYTFSNISSDHTIDVVYIPCYKITTSATNGTITDSITNATSGSSYTISYSPKSGYQLQSVTVDGTKVDITKYPSSYTFSNISSDHTIDVVYIPYWKITTEVTNGTISDDVTEGVTGEDYTIEYSPKNGYLLDTVVVDGKKVDITKYLDSYIFEDLNADHTITVTYAKPETSKEIYLYSSKFSDNYTSGQSIEGYVLVPGDVVEYKISYSNPTSVTRTVVITDTLPNQLNPVSASDNGKISGQKVTWTLSVSAYSSGTVSVYAEVVGDGEFTNTASVTYKALSGSTNESDVTVTDSVTASAMDNPIKWAENENGVDVTDQVISAGDTLTYYIQFTNPSSTTKVFTITDVVPDGTTLVNGSISNGGKYSNGTITWTGISLAGGATTKVAFSVTVDEPNSELTQVPNQATVGVDKVEIDSVATVSPNDDDDYTWVYVLDDPVKVAMSTDGNNLSDYQEVVIEGTYVVYEITTSNPAKYTKTFTITDPLPEYVTYVSSDNGGTYDSNTHTVTWEISVNAGESATVSVTVMVSYGSQGACFENVASVAVDNTSQKTNPASIAVLPSPAKAVTLNGEDADNEPVSVGDELVYSINYYNPSEYMKTFTITDYLPDEVTYVSSDQGGTYNAETHSVTWKITMYGKTYNTVYVHVTVNEGTEGTAFDNHLAYVQVDGAELYTNKVTNWVGKKTVTTVDGSDLSGKSVKAGDTVMYTIYTINSTSEDRYMQIYDNIPAGLTPVSVSDGGTINGQEVTWSVLVGAGYLKEVTVTCTVNSGYNGKLVTNTATVKGVKLTANVSDAGIHIGNETISTGIAASSTPYVIVFSVAIVAVAIISAILVVRKRRR